MPLLYALFHIILVTLLLFTRTDFSTSEVLKSQFSIDPLYLTFVLNQYISYSIGKIHIYS